MFARIKSSRGGSLIIDLLMIVVGINIALWFEGVAEQWREAEAEQQYLVGLRNDLRVDLAYLDQLIGENQAKIEQLQEIVPMLPTMGQASQEQQAQIIFTPSSYYFFTPSDSTYTSMQESGDFRLLSDPDTKKDLLRLVRQYRLIEQLQDNFIQAMDAEYIPLMMAGFDLAEMKITDPALPGNQVFRNFFVFTLQETGQRLSVLKSARDKAGALSETIERQLH
jgi:hypothetical protein